MISIIVCSINPDLLSELEKNIGETIGVPYEVIGIDNSVRGWGICKAYNEGARKAIYPILCFAHEDISFATDGWGQLVIRHLSDPRTGLLGIAGGDARSIVPSSWSIPVISNQINIFQHYKSGKEPDRHIVVTDSDTPAATSKRVLTLDGVWLCTKKEVFAQFRFDESTFTGFHGYDIDYSLQVSTKYNAFVVFDLLIHHYSEGIPDRKWIASALLVSKKWKDKLPRSIYDLPWAAYNLHHWQCLQVFLAKLAEQDYSRPAIIGYYFRYSFTRYFTLRQFFSMGRYLFGLLKNPWIRPQIRSTSSSGSS